MMHSDGHLWVEDERGGRVTEVYSTSEKPRLAGDGCGCIREVRWRGRLQWGDEHVVKLCEKHGREPGIVQYMLL